MYRMRQRAIAGCANPRENGHIGPGPQSMYNGRVLPLMAPPRPRGLRRPRAGDRGTVPRPRTPEGPAPEGPRCDSGDGRGRRHARPGARPDGVALGRVLVPRRTRVVSVSGVRFVRGQGIERLPVLRGGFRRGWLDPRPGFPRGGTPCIP